MLIKGLFSIIAAGILAFPAAAWSIPPNPARIGGTVTMIKSAQVRNADNLRDSRNTGIADNAFTFKVSHLDGADFNPPAQDTDGLNTRDNYVIDIPIYESNEQSGGALPGDTAVVRVFLNSRELEVVSPPNGRIIVGNSGSITPVNLVVQDKENGDVVYTQIQLDQAVAEAIEKWDIGGDGKIDLREAIRALQVVVGVD